MRTRTGTFEETIIELPHGKETLSKLSKGLRDLRWCSNSVCAEMRDEEELSTAIKKWNKRVVNKTKGINLQILEQDNGYIVSADQFPGLSAWGETTGKAMLEFAKALKLYMEVMIEDEEKIG